MTRRMVPSWVAYVSTLAVLFIGFIWATFKPAAPYSIMTQGVIALAGGYFVKRTFDKKINITKEQVNGPTG
jgi:positive regulator of sigma E activity